MDYLQPLSTENRENDLIRFNTIGCGGVRLARKYVTRDRLRKLCAVNDFIITDENGEELFAFDSGEAFVQELDPIRIYNIIDEEDLESDEEPQTAEEHYALQMKLRTKLINRINSSGEERRKLIAELYKPKHPHLYKLTEDIFLPEFLQALKTGTKASLMSILKQETPTKIFSLGVFTMKFCRELIEETINFENSGLPVMRPNSMNNYGVILDEIGFTPFFQELQSKYLQPFTSLLFGDIGSNLDSHHAFIVQYKIGEDLDLGFHYDESEVTLNICLGKEFIGGDLYFRGLLEDKSSHNENFVFSHVPGRGLLHFGKHRHGASKIKSGERYNLILWMRNTTLRRAAHACDCGHEHDH